MGQKKIKKGTPPPRYDEAFKAGAVRLVTKQGRQPTEAAKELGICINTLHSWLKASGVQLGQASRLNREQRRIWELEAEGTYPAQAAWEEGGGHRCLRACLKIGGMTNSEGFFRQTKMVFRRRNGCTSRKISKVWREKAHCWAFCHFSNKP